MFSTKKKSTNKLTRKDNVAKKGSIKPSKPNKDNQPQNQALQKAIGKFIDFIEEDGRNPKSPHSAFR